MFSRATECALQAAVYIALHAEESGPLLSEEIAGQLGLPRPFTQKCLRLLVDGGILNSYRGRSGGFTLARSAREISVYDVVTTVQRLECLGLCLVGQPICTGVTACPLHDLWQRFRRDLEGRLRRTSLARMARTAAGAARFRRPRAASGVPG